MIVDCNIQSIVAAVTGSVLSINFKVKDRECLLRRGLLQDYISNVVCSAIILWVKCEKWKVKGIRIVAPYRLRNSRTHELHLLITQFTYLPLG